MIVLKSSREIDRLRESGLLASEILDRLLAMVAEGISTGDLDAAARRFIEEAGAESAFFGYRGYPGQICTSINEEIVHGIPGKRRVRAGDVLSLDVGIRYNGYIGDLATTVPVGAVDEEKRRLLQAGAEALEAAIAQAVPSNRLHDISYAIEARAAQDGFSVVRDYVGHGVGREMHEEPKVPNYGRPHTGPRLMVGMVLAIEPMLNAGVSETRLLEDHWTAVTADGRPSVHFEHMVAIVDGGHEVLTCRKRNRSALKAS